ncbi:MAG: fused MFS/spermidine synthase, partial [Deltaproteobacteria bacterium]|nr:fused MFS/spermidine synthase [Deltaproteobacteria bacterium]
MLAKAVLHPPERRLVVIALLLFVSGGCALVYQTAWMRQLTLVFGATTGANAAVLAIFMGGLGAGAALLGRRVDAHPRPLVFYGGLEGVIALSVPLTPLLVDLVRAAYIATGGTQTLGAATTPVRLLLASLVLIVPTLAMGGTLPAAARAAALPGDERGVALAVLYAANALGAVAGTLIATFHAFEAYGFRTTLWIACALNAAVAALAIYLGRSEPLPAPPTKEKKETKETAGAVAKQARRGKHPRGRAKAPAEPVAPNDEDAEPTPDPPPAPVVVPVPVWVYGAAFASGFAFFLMELVWYRMLSPLLGGSTFTFGLVLAAALLGIGLGALVYRWPGARRRPTAMGFAAVCGAEAALMLVPLWLGDDLAVLAIALREWGNLGFGPLVAGWIAIVAIVVLPAAFVAGIQFPLLVGLARPEGDRIGARVGRVYAVNTAGAIVGALAGGFGMMSALGAVGAWRLAGIALVVTGAAALAMHVRAHGLTRRAAAAGGP